MRFYTAPFFLMSLSAMAAPSAGIYCNDTQARNRMTNIMSGDFDTCTSELYSGDVCFVGPREKVIKILNSDKVREKFEGTDGEYIKGAHYRGENVGYYAVDEANEWSELKTIKKCD